jgi:drug/metabolite transporter (DMT)-like permease
MPTWLLFAIPATVWSTTFFAITLQLPHAHPAISLTYRFALASACMFFVSRARGELKAMTPKLHLLTALLGLVQYSLSYSMTYNAERFAPSGLASLVFTLLVFLNPIAGALFFKRKLVSGVVIGAALGFAGIAAMFGGSASIDAKIAVGLWLLLGATFSACAGNMLSMAAAKSGLPSSCYTAWGLLYGTLGFALYAFVSGAHWVLPASASYWGSLVYLAVFGTAVAFGFYTVLLNRIGPIAAYMSVVTPFGAVLISVIFEKMILTAPMFLGIALAIMGAGFALKPPKTPPLKPALGKNS